jgi:hypothetical protein
MFCPNCGLEYRPGFARCNDCDVDLVEEPPGKGEGEAGGEELAEPRPLWHGTQGPVFMEITIALQNAGIPYNRESLDARMTFSDNFPLEIWVPAAQLPAAEKILEEVLAPAEPASGESAGPGDSADGGYDDLPPFDAPVVDPHPEDATAGVWSGAGEKLAQFVKSALAANGIGCCLEPGDSGTFLVRVLPGDEPRAREIAREITEGLPPT